MRRKRSKKYRNSGIYKTKKLYMRVIIILVIIGVAGVISLIVNKEQEHLKTLAMNVEQLTDEVQEKEQQYEMTLEQLELAKEQLDIEENNRKLLQTQLDRQRKPKKDTTDLFDKICYLTFDDGPSENTEIILDLLAKNHIKATFFVVYTEYGDENKIYQRIVNEGHSIGNHGYAHEYPNTGRFYDDFYRMQDFLQSEVGFKPDILRVPGGTKSGWLSTGVSAKQAQRLTNEGYVYFDWTTLAKDSCKIQYTPQELVEHVVKYADDREVEVVLMHDRVDNKNTPEALQGIIDYFRFNGYVFMPLNSSVKPPQFYKANK